MSLRLVTAPTTFPVTVAEAKAQARVAFDDDDTLIGDYVSAATDMIERYIGRSIMQQTWEVVLDGFSDSITLPKGPVQSVTSVKYKDAAGGEQTVSSANYIFDGVSDPQRVVKVSDYAWPTVSAEVNSVTVRFVAGYAAVPASIKHAVLLVVSAWYDDRDVGNLPAGAMALLENHRAFA